MKKQATLSQLGSDTNRLQPHAGLNIPESEFPSPVIYKLSEFYRKWPDYPTSIVDITVLGRILHTELDKFLHRPHKQVTQIYFDNDGTDVHRV